MLRQVLFFGLFLGLGLVFAEEPQMTPAEGIARTLFKLLDDDAQGARQMSDKTLPLCNGETPDAVAGRKLIAYITGKEKMSDAALFMATEKDESICALAFLALFIQKIETKRIADKSLLIGDLENYQSNAKASGNKYASGWLKRISAWKEWVRSDFAKQDRLEKLLLKHSSFERLSDVSKLEFVAHHNALQKNRPVVSEIEYDEKSVAAYINGLKDIQIKRAENRRYGCIRQVKEYIVALLARNSYSGRIQLKKTGSFSGTIVRANEKLVDVKRGTGSRGKSASYGWSDFKLEQFAEILNHFAEVREKASTREGSAKQRLDAGEDLLLSAVLLDLAGQPEKAYDVAVKAEKMSAVTAKKVKKVFCDSIPSAEEDEESLKK